MLSKSHLNREVHCVHNFAKAVAAHWESLMIAFTSQPIL